MTLDVRTPAQRVEDARNRARRPLIEALRWIDERPPLMHLADALPVIANIVNHDVTEQDVFEAMKHLRVRDSYDTTSSEPQEQLDAALDVLLDLFDCADCGDVHGHDGGRRECDHGEFCYQGFAAFHAGRPCPSERLS